MLDLITRESVDNMISAALEYHTNPLGNPVSEVNFEGEINHVIDILTECGLTSEEIDEYFERVILGPKALRQIASIVDLRRLRSSRGVLRARLLVAV